MITFIFVMFVLVWLELTQHLSCYGVCKCEFPFYNEEGGGGGGGGGEKKKKNKKKKKIFFRNPH
jgi:hypothetical protein